MLTDSHILSNNLGAQVPINSFFVRNLLLQVFNSAWQSGMAGTLLLPIPNLFAALQVTEGADAQFRRPRTHCTPVQCYARTLRVVGVGM